MDLRGANTTGLGSHTKRKRTELSGHLFSYFYAEAETNTETPETNMKMDTSENRDGTNTVRTRMKSG
jgi:hypothetical protein